jgi:hypothetical protein
MPANMTIRSPTLSYETTKSPLKHFDDIWNSIMEMAILLAGRWGHDGEDEAAVESGASETDAHNDDGPLLIPAEHFHRQQSSDTV